MSASLRGWEAFSTAGALTHFRITWALSPMAPQLSGVTLGSPFAHGVADTPHGEVRNITIHMVECEGLALMTNGQDC